MRKHSNFSCVDTSRRNVSWEYREARALAPLQFMKLEMYYHIANHMMSIGLYLGHVIVLIATLHQRYGAMLTRLESSGMVDVLSRSIERLRQLVKRSKDTLEMISFLMTWILSYGELAMLFVEDLSFYTPRTHRCLAAFALAA